MTNMMMNGVVAINGGVGVMEIRQPLPQTVESVAQPVENLTVNAHISLRELKNTVAAVIEKKLPKYAQLMEMHPVIAARTVVGGATLTAYENKVVINDMDFEEAYNTAIQQKSIAQQNADKQKIENEAAIAKAEADKQVAITKAEAEAQKTSIAADAQAEANRKIAESLSDSLIEYQKIQKWDGRLPTVSGGNALVSIDPAE